MGHSQYIMVHGIVGAWLSSPRTFIGSWSVVGFPHCGIAPLWYCPIVGSYPLIVRFPTTDIILPLWGKTKWVMCEFFHPCPISCPIASWHCRDTKTLPTDFHRSMGRLLHTIVMYGVMVVCIVGIVLNCLHYYYTKWWWKIQ